MRILQAMGGTHAEEADRFFDRLVPALARGGAVQRVLMRADPDRQSMLAGQGVEDLHALPFGGRLDFATRRRFAAHVRSFAPDIVLTWVDRAARHAPVRAEGEARPVHVARFNGAADLRYLRDCDHLLGDCEDSLARLVEDGWPADRASCLPDLVPAAPGRPLPRKSLFIPESAPLLLALGTLEAEQGFEVLLDALAQIPATYLLLAGDGPDAQSLVERATRLGVKPRIRFLGRRDDLADLFATADLLVHPARTGAVGHAVIAGWAHEVPVVAADSRSARALVEDGRTGLLARPGDPAALAQAVIRALADPALCRGMAEAGRRRYERDFTESAVVGRYLAFFESLLP